MRYFLLFTLVLLQGCATFDPAVKQWLVAEQKLRNTFSSLPFAKKDEKAEPELTAEVSEALQESLDQEHDFDLHAQDAVALNNQDTLWQRSSDTAFNKMPNLWHRVRDNYKFDEKSLNKQHTKIQKYLRFYGKSQRSLDRITRQSRPYLYYVIEQIEARGLPGELALLPVVESAYDPFAYSHAHASGIWQFISSTGKDFDLEQNWWHDQRRDVRLSTHAALDYLTQLNKRFKGDWLLALASYNAGAGTVLNAIKKNKARNKPTDFWSLRLPKETKDYIPKLLALASLIENPEAYNLALPEIDNKPYFDIVYVGSQIDLNQAAQLAGISVESLYNLNPSFNRWATTPGENHELLIPIDSVDQFKLALATLPSEERVQWKQHTVKAGDSLNAISKRFKVPTTVLKQVNNLRGNMIHPGNDLLIPSAKNSEQLTYAKAVPSLQRGVKIASRGSLKRKRVSYKVKAGDSLSSIAKNFQVSSTQLAQWNNLSKSKVLIPGSTLAIWKSKSKKTQHSNLASQSPKRKIDYLVKAGDSLNMIAGKFNVSIKDIKRWNPSPNSATLLKPGEALTLYIKVTN